MLRYILIFWNIAVFLLYGYDKIMAVKDGWRIKETTLLLCAFLFGGIGAYLGMISFRHKTKHRIFKVLLPLCFGLSIGFFVGLERL